MYFYLFFIYILQYAYRVWALGLPKIQILLKQKSPITDASESIFLDQTYKLHRFLFCQWTNWTFIYLIIYYTWNDASVFLRLFTNCPKNIQNLSRSNRKTKRNTIWIANMENKKSMEMNVWSKLRTKNQLLLWFFFCWSFQ